MKKDYPSLPSLRYRFRRSLEWIVQRPRNFNFCSRQVLLVDALWFRFEKANWTLYLLALKPLDNDKAVLLDPVLLKGGESYENWEIVLNTIPEQAKERIVALVSDNFGASQGLAQQHKWIHQLCHFHLISQLQIRRGRRKHVILGKNIREKIYQNIRLALEIANEKNLKALLKCLKTLSKRKDCPYRLRMIIHEFLRTINLYRACFLYPEFNLPNTTNALESTAKRIRRLARTISTPKALHLWAIAFARLRLEITCNGKNFTQN